MDKSQNNWHTHAGADGLTSLGLRIPQQTQAPQDSFLTDAKRTDAWFASLPMANIGESARRIFNALVDSNRIEMPDVARARITERFRKPVAYLCSNLQRRYTDLSFPLSPKSRKTASLARELNMELAVAYKIIVERMLSGQKQQFDEKLMVIALHRALFHLGQVLYESAIVYGPWPPSAWREIHAIYAYASHNDVQDVPVKDGVHAQNGKTSTIEDLYKSLLLFAVTDPLHLRQRQITTVFKQVQNWARLTRVELPPKGDDVKDSGQFNLDLWSDMPPVHNSLSPPASNRRVRVLDLRALIRSLREDFDLTDAEEADVDDPSLVAGSGRNLVRVLISGWSKPADRRFVRTHLNFELRIAVALNSIFEAMSDHPPKAAQKPATQQQMSKTLTREVYHSSPLVPSWAASMPHDVSLSPLDSELSNEPVGMEPRYTPNTNLVSEHFGIDFPDSSDDEPAPLTVYTINESAGGYCIRWPSGSVPKIKVGEVVGIQSTSTNHQYAVGIVRWLKQDPARDLEVGMEIVAPRCQAAVIWAQGKKKIGSKTPPRHNCLLLPESNRGAGDNNLITTATDMDIGAELWLERDGENRMIRLTRMVETSGLFSRYDYRYINVEGDERDNTRQFDDLWKNL